MKTKLRHAYGKRNPVTIDTGSEGGAKQSFKDECNINTIVKRFQKTGVVTHLARTPGEYGEATPVDFQEALNIVNEASAMFNDLPSVIRKRFNNDPGEFMDFVHDPANFDEMVKLGIATNNPPEPETPIKVEITNPLPQA